jgi:hypothetical protein
MIDLRNLPKDTSKGECFAITTYCNTEKKIQALNRTIDNLKQYGLPIFIHAHYPLSNEIQNKVDSYYYSSDNPVLSRYSAFWHDTGRFKLEIRVYDTNFTQLKAWSEIIRTLCDYERIHIINYDANITPDVFALSKKYSKSFFLQNPDTSGNYIFATYFCLDKSMYSYFRENITFEKYLYYPQSDQFLPKMEEFIPSFLNDNFNIVPYSEYDIHKMMEYDVVSDTRFDWENSLTLGDVKVFVGEIDGKAKVLFFDVKKDVNISICTFRKLPVKVGDFMGGQIGGVINSETLFSTDIPFNDIDKLIIKVDEVTVRDELIKKLFALESKIYPI